jgi:phosphoribosylformylglycinamidine synthase
MTINIETLKKGFDAVHNAIVRKEILSAYSLKHFGVAEGLAKMCIGNRIGVEFNNVSMQELFGINYGGLIVEVDEKVSINKIFKGINCKVIGTTNSNPYLSSDQYDFSLSIETISEQIVNKLANVFTSTTSKKIQKVELPTYTNNDFTHSKIKVNKPLVVIPVFPGTNCEFDSQRAFEKAGAEVKQVLILNNNAASLLKSIDELEKAINKANIVMIPGGFSAADEPDGSAKFIVNVFKNKKIKAAVSKLLEKRDGLMLGICNGFQALIKLGLLPYGIINNADRNSPTLTFNTIHHHMSSLVRTKIISNKSP